MNSIIAGYNEITKIELCYMILELFKLQN